ncbi:MAG TPA: hypothetical protein VML19_10915 [Verrucomicrobiae bacterium]|nr:hypothetical protein [Verrucomicrobiae bacterium]
MLDRFVSYFSLAVIVTSVILFGCYAWSTASGSMSEGDGLFAMSACMLAGMIFTYRFADPKDVEALSVVKSA